jgi:hypothetical protein
MKSFLRIVLCTLLLPQAALADTAATWLALMPDKLQPDTEVEAPFGGPFYLRTARYESVVKLLDAYVADAKDTSLNQVPAGEELFLSWTRTSRYYCSTVRLQKDVDLITPGEILRGALGVNLFGSSFFTRAKNWQCFRDADKDMRFEGVAGGQIGLGMLPNVQIIDDNEALSVPLRYEPVAAETLPVKLEFGFYGSIRDSKTHRYGISLVMRSPGGDYYFLPHYYKTLRADRDLPADLAFLDGVVTITAITPDETGVPRVRFHIKKPAAATRVWQTSKLLYPGSIEYDLRYAGDLPPDADKKKPQAK